MEAAYVLSSYEFGLHLNNDNQLTSYYRLNEHKSQNYYDILGVESKASIEQIKSAYRKESLRWHPDRHLHATDINRKKCENRFKAVSNAFDCLKDSTERKKYDIKAEKVHDIPHKSEMSYGDALNILVEFVFASLKVQLQSHASPIKLLLSHALAPAFGMHGGADGFIIGAAITLLLNGDGAAVVFRDLSPEQRLAVCNASILLLENMTSN